MLNTHRRCTHIHIVSWFTWIISFGFFVTPATTYYISNYGNDTTSGTSEATAWKTINHVNLQSFVPGDSIRFRSGDSWREELLIKSSGTATAPIVYTSYGEGAQPAILGSNRATNWTAVEGHPNIWQSGTILSAPRQRVNNSVTNHPSSIFFGETKGSVTWGTMENIHLNREGAPTDICLCNEQGTGFTLMDSEYDWCWQDNHIYIYAPSDPTTRYSFIEVPQRVSTIRTTTHPPEEHIIIDGFELLFALKYGYDDGWPMNTVVRGLTIRNCHIGYMGVKGAASAMGLQIWHSDMLVQNNTIHDCGRRNISYNVYGDVRSTSLTFENVLFENNELYNGYHTTGFDISCGYTDTFRNFIFRNNFIWDNPDDDPTNTPNDFTSMGMFLDAGNATFTNFKVYNNILRYTKQKGITVNSLTNSDITNNTFYGMNVRAGDSGYRAMINVAGTVSELRIDNNIFYGNVAEQFVLSAVTFSGTTHTGTTLNNNLYYHENSSQRIITINAGSSYRMSNWASYKLDTKWDLQSPVPAHPQFVNAPQNLMLLKQSPARSAGKPVIWLTTDHLGNSRDPQHPSIGAYEFETDSRVQEPFVKRADEKPVLVVSNESKGIIHIRTLSQKTFECAIFDLLGKLVQKKTFQNSLQLKFEPGIYFIDIKGYGYTAIQEVMVMK